jgi:hypothetical protein
LVVGVEQVGGVGVGVPGVEAKEGICRVESANICDQDLRMEENDEVVAEYLEALDRYEKAQKKLSEGMKDVCGCLVG